MDFKISDEWSRPEGVTTNFNSVKLQVRQHNSSLVCSETKETNPESSSAAAASVICRKEGSDGDNNGDFDDSQSSHKGRNLVIASHSAQQGNQMLVYESFWLSFSLV